MPKTPPPEADEGRGAQAERGGVRDHGEKVTDSAEFCQVGAAAPRKLPGGNENRAAKFGRPPRHFREAILFSHAVAGGTPDPSSVVNPRFARIYRQWGYRGFNTHAEGLLCRSRTGFPRLRYCFLLQPNLSRAKRIALLQHKAAYPQHKVFEEGMGAWGKGSPFFQKRAPLPPQGSNFF